MTKNIMMFKIVICKTSHDPKSANIRWRRMSSMIENKMGTIISWNLKLDYSSHSLPIIREELDLQFGTGGRDGSRAVVSYVKITAKFKISPKHRDFVLSISMSKMKSVNISYCSCVICLTEDFGDTWNKLY